MNLVNYFATSICQYVIQVVLSTGVFKLFAQVYISKFIQVHNSYMSLLKKKTHISKNLTNLPNQKRKN